METPSKRPLHYHINQALSAAIVRGGAGAGGRASWLLGTLFGLLSPKSIVPVAKGKLTKAAATLPTSTRSEVPDTIIVSDVSLGDSCQLTIGLESQGEPWDIQADLTQSKKVKY